MKCQYLKIEHPSWVTWILSLKCVCSKGKIIHFQLRVKPTNKKNYHHLAKVQAPQALVAKWYGRNINMFMNLGLRGMKNVSWAMRLQLRLWSWMNTTILWEYNLKNGQKSKHCVSKSARHWKSEVFSDRFHVNPTLCSVEKTPHQEKKLDQQLLGKYRKTSHGWSLARVCR